MKNYRIIWYIGSVVEVKEILAKKTVKAEDIYKVNWQSVLPAKEKKIYNLNLKHCFMITLLEENKKHSIDYGSYSKFVLIEEI